MEEKPGQSTINQTQRA